jgi:hypothetical protein
MYKWLYITRSASQSVVKKGDILEIIDWTLDEDLNDVPGVKLPYRNIPFYLHCSDYIFLENINE